MTPVVRQLAFIVLGLQMAIFADAQETQSTLLAPQQALPEPLTLDHALKLAIRQHPSLQRLEATKQGIIASKQLIEASNNLEVNLEGVVRWVEPSERAIDQSRDDHRLGLIASKNLYDFGRQESQLNAAKLDIESEEFRYQQALQQHRIEVMRRFFDVLLADAQFYRYNEEMAVAYIQWDRKKERQRLKQAIDVDVLELETEYQKIRRLRYHSEAMQRQTRARLAAALNRPGSLPATLVLPHLPILKTELPDVDELQKLASQNNLALQMLRKKVASAQQRVEASRSSYDPSLTGTVEAYSYARELGSSDAWRAGVTLDVPLYYGDRRDATVTQAKASEYQLQAQLHEAEYNIAQVVLETWLKIDTLRIQRDEMKTRANYEEMYLDQSRALYELEIKADLGKSMVRVSEAEYLVRQTDYEMAIAWEQLKLLTGQFNIDPSIENQLTTGSQQ